MRTICSSSYLHSVWFFFTLTYFRSNPPNGTWNRNCSLKMVSGSVGTDCFHVDPNSDFEKFFKKKQKNLKLSFLKGVTILNLLDFYSVLSVFFSKTIKRGAKCCGKVRSAPSHDLPESIRSSSTVSHLGLHFLSEEREKAQRTLGEARVLCSSSVSFK